MIPYSRQTIDQSDIDAVTEVLSSDYLTQGERVPIFEKQLSDHCGATYAVAISSATAALHVACLALGVGKGDLVWIPAITFVASANCARYCGADVDFIDVDPKTGNLSVEVLAAKLDYIDRAGDKMPKVLVVVHFAGLPAELEKIHQLSQKYGFNIIEDAAHALGASYQNDPIGNCRFSDICVFSFHPLKSITTGEGGMALTNQVELAHRMRLFAGHGIERDRQRVSDQDKPDWYYEQVVLGYNYRMSDIHAALGISQFTKLKDFVEKRRTIASAYQRQLDSLSITLPVEFEESLSAWHLYSIRISSPNTKNRRDEVYRSMRERGIGVQLHYIPVYRHPYFNQMGFSPGDFPEAEAHYAESLSLPCFPDFNSRQQQFVVDALTDALI